LFFNENNIFWKLGGLDKKSIEINTEVGRGLLKFSRLLTVGLLIETLLQTNILFTIFLLQYYIKNKNGGMGTHNNLAYIVIVHGRMIRSDMSLSALLCNGDKHAILWLTYITYISAHMKPRDMTLSAFT
jgi:hypothetical protein